MFIAELCGYLLPNFPQSILNVGLFGLYLIIYYLIPMLRNLSTETFFSIIICCIYETPPEIFLFFGVFLRSMCF